MTERLSMSELSRLIDAKGIQVGSTAVAEEERDIEEIGDTLAEEVEVQDYETIVNEIREVVHESEVEPKEHLGKTQPFASKVKQLEIDFNSMMSLLMEMRNEIDLIRGRTDRATTDIAGLRKDMTKKGDEALERRVKGLSDQLQLHIQRGHR